MWILVLIFLTFVNVFTFQTATATVIINVVDVNDNGPVIYVDDTVFRRERQPGIVTTIRVWGIFF